MDDASRTLRLALLDVYLPYVQLRLGELDVDPADFTSELDRAKAKLGEALETLLAQPYRQQRRGPLELFQEAMAVPTELLIQLGIDPPERDETARAALPGDVFDLAPASSRALGEEVWAVHVAWGATKAATLRAETTD